MNTNIVRDLRAMAKRTLPPRLYSMLASARRKLAAPPPHPPTHPPGSFFIVLPREFDPAWYRKTYLISEPAQDPLDHYLQRGMKAGNSPNKWFDESFYLSFYPDIRKSVANGGCVCGFDHFLTAGRREGRLPHFELQKTLETRLPGITRPTQISLIDDLLRRLKPISAIKTSREEPTFWFLLPMLNPDIFFGGYRAMFEFIARLRRRGRKIKILICDNCADNLEYFLYHYRNHPLADALFDVEVLHRWQLSAPLQVGPCDRIFAYSAWEAHLAHRLASLTNEHRFVFFVQEYEPVFHEHGSINAVVAEAYQLPHMPFFNSDILRIFFEQSQLGVFSKELNGGANKAEYAVIEHVLTPLKPPTRESMLKKSGTRRFVMYARPEPHAERNLFAVGVLGLRRAIERGIVKGSWELVGVGALSEGHKVYLPEGYELYLQPKMNSAEYAKLLSGTDVGLSLMYAPHPGLVAYELAKAGAKVVTNTFGIRSDKFIRSISENLVPCAPTIEGIASGIEQAILGLEDIESRLRGAQIPAPHAWDEVYNDNFFSSIAGFC